MGDYTDLGLRLEYQLLYSAAAFGAKDDLRVGMAFFEPRQKGRIQRAVIAPL